MGIHDREQENYVPAGAEEKRRLKKRAEAAIEALLALLDEMDGDVEREHTALECCGSGFFYSGPDDAEDTDDGENDPADWGVADLDGVTEQYPGGFYGSSL